MKSPTNWMLSTMNAEPVKPLSEGIHTVQITAAVFHDDENYYSVSLKSLDCDHEQSTLRYYILKKDGSRNEPAIGTLNKLGFCIYGQYAGIPYPDDIVNGIVEASVSLQSYEGKTYVNVYEYHPVSASDLDIAKQSGLTTIDQYTEN